MDIVFRTRKLEVALNSASALQKTYGARMAKVIMKRMAVLRAANNLSMVPNTRPDRLHQLRGDRDGQLAVDLVQPWRLVFKVSHEPAPRADDGGLDMERVKAIMILDVADYH